MAVFSVPHVRLRAIAAALPRNEVHNQNLLSLNEVDRQVFTRSVGINARRVAPANVCASDLCIAASRRLMEETGVRPDQVGLLVFVTQTPDYPLPGNSVLAQQRLGLERSTYLLDINQGCAGYVYGLATLAGLMHAAHIDRGLLLAGDTLTRIVSEKDGSAAPIFSDAGSATLLEADPHADPMYFNLGSDGKGASAICVPGGGARQPYEANSLALAQEAQNIARAPIHMAMRGLDVLHYCAKYVAPNITELLEFVPSGLHPPDYYVFHQANRILNETLLRRLKIPAEKAPETLSVYGNTSSATIPITICRRLSEELASGAKTLLLSGFGAGFSWGSALVRAEGLRCAAPLEIDEEHETKA